MQAAPAASKTKESEVACCDPVGLCRCSCNLKWVCIRDRKKGTSPVWAETGLESFSYRARPCLSLSSHYHTGSQPLALVDLFTPSAASLHRITNSSDIRSLLCIAHLHNNNTCIALQTYRGIPARRTYTFCLLPPKRANTLWWVPET
jgi:hypothetical protein